MIVSNDTIMVPPYEITPKILKLVSNISEKIGEINTSFLVQSSPKLRKQNQIKTIHASLKIEGNTLTEKQITAILENKRVLAPEQDIREVKNAINVYNQIDNFNYSSINSFKNAHKLLLRELINDAGKFRNGGVGIVKGSEIQHLAPPAENVLFLMNDLFSYLKNNEELVLIKSCVFHYEVEFIHPFSDGNGRMGRLWQTVILMSNYPIFQFIPFENLIASNQQEYYNTLSKCDKFGNSTLFIEYILSIINSTLEELIGNNSPSKMSQKQRLEFFCKSSNNSFTRKEYMNIFKQISSASASRDLRVGVENGFFTKVGDKRKTIYHLSKF